MADLGSLNTRGEQAIAAECVLAALRRSAARQPVLVVVDEVTQQCPCGELA